MGNVYIQCRNLSQHLQVHVRVLEPLLPGTCTCPNGQKYLVSGANNCETLNCVGGTMGTDCTKSYGAWSRHTAYCFNTTTPAVPGDGWSEAVNIEAVDPDSQDSVLCTLAALGLDDEPQAQTSTMSLCQCKGSTGRRLMSTPTTTEEGDSSNLRTSPTSTSSSTSTPSSLERKRRLAGGTALAPARSWQDASVKDTGEFLQCVTMPSTTNWIYKDTAYTGANVCAGDNHVRVIVCEESRVH